MKNIFLCVAVIIGTIIGAGFASGKEIISFFNIYGNKGILGIIISSIIFGIITIMTITVVNKRKIENYKTLVNGNKLMPIVLQMFSLVCFCIMISGVGAFFSEQLGINFWYGTLLAASISYAMFLNRFNGIETFSMFLVPVIIIGILVLGFSNYEEIEITKNVGMQINETGNFLISAILYASYNSLILVPILINFKKYNLKNSKILLIGVLVTVILGTLMLLIYNVNNLFYTEISKVELPNMHIASYVSPNFKILYGLVMLMAIFTTAFSCGFSFLEMRKKENYEKNAFIICVGAVVCSRFGFSNMINICFPVFGILGIFQIILIFLENIRSKKWKKINLYLFVLW